jgi:hypothetical protein
MRLTQRDTDQIIKHTHDEQLNASRVVLVNGIDVDSDKIANAMGDAIGKLNFNQPSTNVPSFHNIEVPVIVKEYQPIYIDRPVVEIKIVEIEKPVIVEKIQVVEIEKQLIVYKPEIVRVEIPVIITKYEPIPKWVKVSFIVFLGLLIINMFSTLLKH